MKKFVKLIISTILIVISAFCIAGCSDKTSTVYLDLENLLYTDVIYIEPKNKKQEVYVGNFQANQYVNSFDVRTYYYKIKDGKVKYTEIIDWDKSDAPSDFFKYLEYIYIS